MRIRPIRKRRTRHQRGAEESTLRRGLGSDPPRDNDQNHRFDELFDETNQQVNREVLLQVRLKEGGAKNPKDSADEESKDELQCGDISLHPFDDEEHDTERHQEAAKKDEGWNQVCVGGHRRHDSCDDPEGESGEERFPPPPVVMVTMSEGTDGHGCHGDSP